MTLAWRLTPGQSLLHRCWGDEAVIYNDISGATHLLAEGALQLLCALRDGDLLPDEAADPQVQEWLEQLARLQLVEAC